MSIQLAEISDDFVGVFDGFFGDDVINSYIKLKNQELDSFDKEESFDKRSSITEWEKINTLDC